MIVFKFNITYRRVGAHATGKSIKKLSQNNFIKISQAAIAILINICFLEYITLMM